MKVKVISHTHSHRGAVSSIEDAPPGSALIELLVVRPPHRFGMLAPSFALYLFAKSA
jgi:hypothetical protein